VVVVVVVLTIPTVAQAVTAAQVFSFSEYPILPQRYSHQA
jgi:hypothetical protein